MLRTLLRAVGLVVLLAVAGFFVLAPGIVERGKNRVVPHAPYEISAAAQQLHDQLIIGDWHADPTLWNRNLAKRGSYGQVDFPRLVEGNVAVQTFTTVTKSPAGQNYDQNAADAWDQITWLALGQMWPPRTWSSRTNRALFQALKIATIAEESDGMVRIIRTKRDLAGVLEARAAGLAVTGALIGAEGAHAIDEDIRNLEPLFQAGFRVMGLQHFFDNAVGGSLHGISQLGLTEFGRAVVWELEQRSMIVDVAHSSPQVVRDVLALVRRPIIVSHTGIYSHCPTKRNFADELMVEIAAAGGLIGIGYWADVTCDATPAGIAKTIMAAIDLVGEDHVSLGSDFDGSVETTFDVSELAALTQALLDLQLAPSTIAKVMGGNMIAFLNENLPD